MAFLKYRASLTPTLPTSTTLKTSGLTNEEVDANFKSLDDSKIDVLGGNMTGPLTSTSTLQSEFPIIAPDIGKNSGSAAMQYDLALLIDTLSSRTISTGTTPTDATVDPTGNWFFVVNNGSNSVSIFPSSLSSDAAQTTITTPSSPWSGVFHPNGRHFYVISSSGSTHTLTRITYSGNTWGSSQASTWTSPGLTYQFVVMHPSGKYIYIMSTSAPVIQAYSLNAETGAVTYINQYGSAIGTAGTNFVNGVDIDPSGRFLFLTEFTNSIAKTIQTQRINSDGSLTSSSIYTITGSESWTPRGFKVHPSGKHLYYFIEEGSSTAAKIYHFSINSSTGALTLVKTYTNTEADNGVGYIGTGFSSTPHCISRDGTTLFATRAGTNAQMNVFRIDPFTGRIGFADGFNGAATSGQLSKVCVHPFTNRVYQVYNTSNTIRFFVTNDFRSSWAYADRLKVTSIDLGRTLSISGYTSGSITIKAPVDAGTGTILLPLNGGGTFVTTNTITSLTSGAADSLSSARTITIGSTSKTFNGTADVSWTLAEIGAASTNQTMFIGTTSVAINRATGNLSLSGVSIDGNAGTVTNGVYTTGAQSIAGAKTFTDSIGVAVGGVASDPYAPVSVTRNTTGDNAYFALIRSGSIPWQLGINTSNALVFGTSGTGGSAATISNSYATLTNAGDFTALGNVTAYSDVRLKTDINRINDALLKVKQLNGYTFLRTDTNQRQTGLIAQEVEKVLPEAVFNSGDYLSLAYGNMMGLLIEAIKEQQVQIEELKTALKT